MSRHPVAIYRQDRPAYPDRPPYHPPARYPEFPDTTELDATNAAFVPSSSVVSGNSG